MTVTMLTQIDDESVVYTVHTGDPTHGDFSDGREVWRKEVPFGQRDRFRAGGAAFVQAAREQAEIAESYAMMPGEPRDERQAAIERGARGSARGRCRVCGRGIDTALTYCDKHRRSRRR